MCSAVVASSHWAAFVRESALRRSVSVIAYAWSCWWFYSVGFAGPLNAVQPPSESFGFSIITEYYLTPFEKIPKKNGRPIAGC